MNEKQLPGIRKPYQAAIASQLFSLLRWLPALLFLGLFFFFPLAKILSLGLGPEALKTLDPTALQTAVRSLGFTFYQAALSTVLTIVLGLPAAYLFAHYDFRGKSLLRALTAIPFMLPTVVVAAGFNALLGPRGWINLGLMNFFGFESPPIQVIGSLSGILLAHVFYNTTIVIRIVGNAWAHLDPRLEQAARMLGANPLRAWMTVTLPLLKPAILAAALLVFLFNFTSFGVILLMGGSRFATLEVEIYIQALKMLNLPLAAVLSLIQLACTLAFSILYSRSLARIQVVANPRTAVEKIKKAVGWRERIFVAGITGMLLIFFVLPVVALPVRSMVRLEAERGQRTEVQIGMTDAYYQELFINRRGSVFYVPPIEALKNSLMYAGMTVFLSLVLGFPAAVALSRPGVLERWIDPFILLPLGASAVTLGLGFIVAFNKPPLQWVASPWLIPLAHTTIALPFVIRTLQPMLAAIPERLREAAAMLGASPLYVWRYVDFPIIIRAILSAATFAFTVSLGEFGASMLLSRPEYPTLPTAIYRFLSQPGALNYGQAMAMATILMLIATLGILMIEKFRVPGKGEF